MSNYGSNAPPSTYQGAPQQNYNAQQQQGYQPTSSYGHPGHAHKPGGTFGQMMNQAVTTGKPMFDKLGKTLSSKLGNKPAVGPPQHLQSYQNYQNHQNPQGQTQSYQQQQQAQTYSPQPQQQQWQQAQQQQAPPPPPPPPQTNTYTPTQSSPYQQSNYGTPVSGQMNQNNYFPQQSSPPPNQTPNPPPTTQSPVPQQPPNAPGYTLSEYGHAQQGQQGQQAQLGQNNAAQPHGFYQQDSYPGQQSGVIGGGQTPGYSQATQPGYPQSTQGPYGANVPSETPAPSVPAPQSQWGYPPEKTTPVGIQQQPYQPGPYQQEQQQQQWHPMSPVTPQGQAPSSMPPPSVSPPPPQQSYTQPHMPPSNSGHTQPSTPAPQNPVPQAAPTEFIAELPADLGNLKITESPSGTGPGTPASQYQAYNPSAQNGSPAKGFSVPRRAMSTSTVPLADPWRYADPITETPTREFYILADLLFDALDRKCEPNNTGLLEAPKILMSWIELNEEAHKLYSYNNYTALAHMWALQGIPHIMVPVQPALAPLWNFDQQAHAQEMKVIAEPPSATSTYATYMPALNRAGWYKFFFLEIIHSPDDIAKLLPAFCSDTYKPGVMNHPDLNKRDKSEIAALQARAADVQTIAIRRVCDEAKTAMMLDPNISASTRSDSSAAPQAESSTASGSIQPGSPEDVAVRMHKIQMERQFNDMAVKTVLGGGVTFGGGGGGYSGGYGSLV